LLEQNSSLEKLGMNNSLKKGGIEMKGVKSKKKRSRLWRLERNRRLGYLPESRIKEEYRKSPGLSGKLIKKKRKLKKDTTSIAIPHDLSDRPIELPRPHTRWLERQAHKYKKDTTSTAIPPRPERQVTTKQDK
jgi:hypothetical protein